MTLTFCHGEPDWRRFDWLEIGPFHEEWGACEPEDATGWCVFGHEIPYTDEDGHEQGGCEDLVDCASLKAAERVAGRLSKKTGLPIHYR